MTKPVDLDIEVRAPKVNSFKNMQVLWLQILNIFEALIIFVTMNVVLAGCQHLHITETYDLESGSHPRSSLQKDQNHY